MLNDGFVSLDWIDVNARPNNTRHKNCRFWKFFRLFSLSNPLIAIRGSSYTHYVPRWVFKRQQMNYPRLLGMVIYLWREQHKIDFNDKIVWIINFNTGVFHSNLWQLLGKKTEKVRRSWINCQSINAVYCLCSIYLIKCQHHFDEIRGLLYCSIKYFICLKIINCKLFVACF